MEGEKEIKGKLSILLDHVEYILHPTFEEPRRGNVNIMIKTIDLINMHFSQKRRTLHITRERLGRI